MRLSNGSDVQRLLASNPGPTPQVFAMGYVTTVLGSMAQVFFDEDLAETQTPLTALDSYSPVLGDRVLLGKINRAWVILGRITATGLPNWQPLTLNTDWSNIGGAWGTAGYCILGGMVCFRGVISKATAIASLETFAPVGAVAAGYRPAARELFTSQAGSAATGVTLRLYVDPSGFVAISNTNVPPVGSNFGLACIRYPAEQ